MPAAKLFLVVNPHMGELPPSHPALDRVCAAGRLFAAWCAVPVAAALGPTLAVVVNGWRAAELWPALVALLFVAGLCGWLADRATSVVTAAPGRPPSRQNKRVVSVYVEPEALKQLGILAIQEDASVQALMVEALNDLFAKRGVNRIA